MLPLSNPTQANPFYSAHRPDDRARVRSAMPDELGLPKPSTSSDSIRFSGGEPVRFGGIKESWNTFTSLKSHLKANPENTRVLKAYALKFGPDVAFPALCAIPVVGWAAAILTMPFTSMISNKGDKAVEKIAKEGNKGIAAHLATLHNMFENRKSNETPETFTDKVADEWNAFVEKFFDKKLDNHGDQKNHNADLRKKLTVNAENRKGKGFERLKSLVNALFATERHWLVGNALKPLSWIRRKVSKMPGPLRRILVAPKVIMVGLFWYLGKAPKPKKV